jgi:hypothetical protein
MPQLGSVNVKKLYLPSTESATQEDDKAWVTLDTSITAGTISSINESDNDIDKSASMLVNAIQDWNYTDADGVTKTAITKDNIKKLSMGDFGFLTAAITEEINTSTKGIDQGLKEI